MGKSAPLQELICVFQAGGFVKVDLIPVAAVLAAGFRDGAGLGDDLPEEPSTVRGYVAFSRRSAATAPVEGNRRITSTSRGFSARPAVSVMYRSLRARASASDDGTGASPANNSRASRSAAATTASTNFFASAGSRPAYSASVAAAAFASTAMQAPRYPARDHAGRPEPELAGGRPSRLSTKCADPRSQPAPPSVRSAHGRLRTPRLATGRSSFCATCIVSPSRRDSLGVFFRRVG